MIFITIEGEPPRVTAQQKGVYVAGGRPFFYTKKKIKQAEQGLIAHMRTKAPARPIDGPCIVEVTYIWSLRQAERKSAGLIPHTQRPDVDNLVKLVMDAMVNAKWIVDDSQVYILRVSKYRGSTPCMTINLARHTTHEMVEH